MGTGQVHVLFGQPGVRYSDAERLALYVGNHVLGGGGMINRLFETVREGRGLAYSVYSYFYPMRERGPFVAGLQTRADQADEALELVRSEIDRFIRNGPTEEELANAKRNITGGFPLRIDSNGDLVDYLAYIGFYRLPLDYLETYNRRIEAIDVEQVRAAFRRFLQPDRMVAVVVGGDRPEPSLQNVGEQER